MKTTARKTKAQSEPETVVFRWEKTGDDCIRLHVPDSCREYWEKVCAEDGQDPELEPGGKASFYGIESTEWALNAVNGGPKGIQIISVCYRYWR